MHSRLSPGLLCIHWDGTECSCQSKNTHTDEPGLQPLLSSVFPVPVSGLPQHIPLIQTPGRRRMKREEGMGRGQRDRAVLWLRVAKTEEVIETGSQPAEQDPRHKRLGRRMHATDKYTHTHTHTQRYMCWLKVQKKGGARLTDKTGAWGMCWKRHPQSFVDLFPRLEWRKEWGWLSSAWSRAGSVLGIRRPCGRMLCISN